MQVVLHLYFLSDRLAYQWEEFSTCVIDFGFVVVSTYNQRENSLKMDHLVGRRMGGWIGR